jgi:hypothetical protein
MSKSKIILASLILLLLAISVTAQHSISTPAGPVYSYSHLSTLTTTTVKASAGVLHSVLVNGSGSSPCLAIVYDSTNPSGNQVAAVDCSSSKQLNYDVALANGLTVVMVSTATPTPAAADITITFQ